MDTKSLSNSMSSQVLFLYSDIDFHLFPKVSLSSCQNDQVITLEDGFHH